jgi:hypothetical protein
MTILSALHPNDVPPSSLDAESLNGRRLYTLSALDCAPVLVAIRDGHGTLPEIAAALDCTLSVAAVAMNHLREVGLIRAGLGKHFGRYVPNRDAIAELAAYVSSLGQGSIA